MPETIAAIAAETAPNGTGAGAAVIPLRCDAVRIQGYDAARAVAVFGMVVVNYYVIFPGDAYPEWYSWLADVLYGRAAALFVMLTGVGIALMSRRAYFSGGSADYEKVRTSLFKRSFILLVIGMSFMRWWGADILHFYSIYLVAGALLLKASSRSLWVLIIVLLISSAMLFYFTDGSPGMGTWLGGQGFLVDVIDDLFFNGYYSALPWMMFLFIGIWLGRYGGAQDKATRRMLLACSLSVITVSELLAGYLPQRLMEIAEAGTFDTLLISGVFPVTPLFSISAAASAVAVIVLALNVSVLPVFSVLTRALVNTGKLSLTIYITHIFIGFWMERIVTSQTGSRLYDIIPLSFTIGFCVLAVIFSSMWLRRFKRGPIEWLLRSLSNSL